jgi:hypothetical protein
MLMYWRSLRSVDASEDELRDVDPRSATFSRSAPHASVCLTLRVPLARPQWSVRFR